MHFFRNVTLLLRCKYSVSYCLCLLVISKRSVDAGGVWGHRKRGGLRQINTCPLIVHGVEVHLRSPPPPQMNVNGHEIASAHRPTLDTCILLYISLANAFLVSCDLPNIPEKR